MDGKDDSADDMSPRRERLRELFARKASVSELIAQDAADWFVANREALDTTQAATFAAWLRASPQNIEEYLNIASIGRDLHAACNDPEMSFEELMKRALETEEPVDTAESPDPLRSPSSPRRPAERKVWRPQRWLSAAVAVAAIAVLTLGFLFWQRSAPVPPDPQAIAYNLDTRHGEQLTRQLPDDSTLKLDTDTSVSVRFDHTQRLVWVTRGRAEFKVAHEPTRRFVVRAGTVAITDVGTTFDVDAQAGSTEVTVLEGRVLVAKPTLDSSGGANGRGGLPSPYLPIEVVAGQRVSIENGAWPPTYTTVDSQRATAWLRRQIVFQNEPLERVAAEFNRYGATPVEIDSPTLRTLTVSGVFAADDTESFVAFLRSLDGVQVEVTPTLIRVSRK